MLKKRTHPVTIVHGTGLSVTGLELSSTHLNQVAIEDATDKTDNNDNCHNL
jgi:hypothetical protein